MFTFYLMTEKGYAVLKYLVEHQLTNRIDCVIGARDKNVQKDFFAEIQNLCAENGITFYERAKAVRPTSAYSFAISWRWLIAAENLIVLHDSLLPRYRGFAPLISALINGDTRIGVTALLADDSFDTGDIVLQKSMAITYPVKINEVIKTISPLYVEIVAETVQKLINGNGLSATKQDNATATYSLWRDEEDYKIEWSDSSICIERFIDAVGFPYNGAATFIDGEKMLVTNVGQVPDVFIENRTPGKILFIEKGLPVVVCGTGLLKIKTLSREDGTNALPLRNFRTRLK